MKRLLPPLLVVLVVGGVAVRYALKPAQDRARGRVLALVDAESLGDAERRQAEAEIEHYYQTYGASTDDAWFTVRAWLKLGKVEAARRTVAQTPALAQDPATPRRLAELMLRVLGFQDDEHLERPKESASAVRLVLAEAGISGAGEALDHFIRTGEDLAVIPLFYRAFLRSDLATLGRVVEGMATRGDEPSRVATAVAQVGFRLPATGTPPEPVLLETVRGPLRSQRRPLWSASCWALGSGETEEGLRALQEVAQRLADGTSRIEREDRAIAAIGLVASGHWEGEDLARVFFDPELAERTSAFVATWYTEAVVQRVRQGDPKGFDRLEIIWRNAPRMRMAQLRERIATHLLLRDPVEVPAERVEQMLADLESPDANPAQQVIAAAWRLRQGDPSMTNRILDLLVHAANPTRSQQALTDPNITNPQITGLRAILLYSR